METNSFEDLGEVDSFTEQINTDHHASGITIALDGEPMMEDDEPWEDEGAYEEQPYILADVLYDFTGADETELTVMVVQI
ncbi:hypothetical protein SARC_14669 [Sphaeroforma arctica JP610]|uniref:Uncharacterized protein n=1 Tax=Sphaeroforma arctica JP610 TaxID=667725 RepID=A0A0L0F7V5_9EUKA|nr:hypothetical protein SARC_14669 [Sphaeroforma arctica JP610]KNC72769.1 hypothetical protein SARC_14669 [Sphaeroforma arctica JP610]|eukprot:XP_014146671.1 hypothetical protein SARC_14669 [Sphaeroforma arctica JP610]